MFSILKDLKVGKSVKMIGPQSTRFSHGKFSLLCDLQCGSFITYSNCEMCSLVLHLHAPQGKLVEEMEMK